jgi:hypothetical protein
MDLTIDKVNSFSFFIAVPSPDKLLAESTFFKFGFLFLFFFLYSHKHETVCVRAVRPFAAKVFSNVVGLRASAKARDCRIYIMRVKIDKSSFWLL